MPFTFAHAAAILPLRRRLVFSALVVGSFGPDLEFFLRLAHNDERFGHSLLGAAVFTLPASLAVLWLYHRFAKQEAVALLPATWQSRLAVDPHFRFGGARRFALIVATLAVGIATHLLWDNFTHVNTFAYNHWALLRISVPLPGGGQIPFRIVSWYGWSAVGAAIMLEWLRRCYRATPPSHPVTASPSQSRVGRLRAILGIGLAAALVRAVFGVGLPDSMLTWSDFIGQLAISFVAFVWWQLVALGVWSATTRRDRDGLAEACASRTHQ